MFYQMSIRQCYAPIIYNNDCLPVADIVKVSHHVQSGHPDKPLGRIPWHLLRMCFNVIGYWLEVWQGKMVILNYVVAVLYVQVLRISNYRNDSFRTIFIWSDWLSFLKNYIWYLHFRFVKIKLKTKENPKFNYKSVDFELNVCFIAKFNLYNHWHT